MKTVILDFDGILNKANTAIKTVEETIKEMYAMGVTLTLTSNHEKTALENILNELNLSSYFSMIVTADDKKSIGKDDNLISVILEHTDSAPSQTLVVVGENMANTILSKSAGVKACVIKTGKTEDMPDVDYIIHDIRALLDIV